MARGRPWLILLGVVLIIVMIIGILFSVHEYYHQFGGQGWLKAKTQNRDIQPSNEPQLYLPLRQIQMFKEQWFWERTVGGDVPYYTCGDQQNSCNVFGQPDICCPIQMTCYATSVTTSGIYCCNSTDTQAVCQINEENQPKCMPSLVECSAETGGGCCPSTSECSPNGCVHVHSASVISFPYPTPTSWSSSSLATSVSSGIPATLIPVTVTSTVFEAPEATQTLAKEGEIAQVGIGEGINPFVVSLWIPYSAALVAICIAGMMGRL